MLGIVNKLEENFLYMKISNLTVFVRTIDKHKNCIVSQNLNDELGTKRKSWILSK